MLSKHHGKSKNIYKIRIWQYLPLVESKLVVIESLRRRFDESESNCKFVVQSIRMGDSDPGLSRKSSKVIPVRFYCP